jgi:hypothetical protein
LGAAAATGFGAGDVTVSATAGDATIVGTGAAASFGAAGDVTVFGGADVTVFVAADSTVFGAAADVTVFGDAGATAFGAATIAPIFTAPIFTVPIFTAPVFAAPAFDGAPFDEAAFAAGLGLSVNKKRKVFSETMIFGNVSSGSPTLLFSRGSRRSFFGSRIPTSPFLDALIPLVRSVGL